MNITTWNELYNEYEDIIDEMYEPVVIAGILFRPAYVLRKLDPIAFKLGASEWADSLGIDTDDLEGNSDDL